MRCLLGFHKWSKWSKVGADRYQYRVCERCGIMKIRGVGE